MPDVLFDVIEDGATVDVIVENPVIDLGVNETVVAVVTVEGPAGPQGPPGTGTQVFDETPTGVRDGVNLVFTTAHPYLANTVAVFRNGLRERRGIGFTESGAAQITFTTAPESTDDLAIDYVMA